MQNVMSWICFVGQKTNVMTLMSRDLENVMTFIFSWTPRWNLNLQTHITIVRHTLASYLVLRLCDPRQSGLCDIYFRPRGFPPIPAEIMETNFFWSFQMGFKFKFIFVWGPFLAKGNQQLLVPSCIFYHGVVFAHLATRSVWGLNSQWSNVKKTLCFLSTEHPRAILLRHVCAVQHWSQNNLREHFVIRMKFIICAWLLQGMRS